MPYNLRVTKALVSVVDEKKPEKPLSQLEIEERRSEKPVDKK